MNMSDNNKCTNYTEQRYTIANEEQRRILTLSKGNPPYDLPHFYRTPSMELPLDIISPRKPPDVMTRELSGHGQGIANADPPTSVASAVFPIRASMSQDHLGCRYDQPDSIPYEDECPNPSDNLDSIYNGHYVNDNVQVLFPPSLPFDDYSHLSRSRPTPPPSLDCIQELQYRHNSSQVATSNDRKHPKKDDSATGWVRNTFFHLPNGQSSCESTSPLLRGTTSTICDPSGFALTSSTLSSRQHHSSSNVDIQPPSWFIRQQEPQLVDGDIHKMAEAFDYNQNSSQSRLLSIGGRHDRFDSNVTLLSDSQQDVATSSTMQLYPSIRPVGPTSTLETFETPAYDRFPTDGILQFFLQDLQAKESQSTDSPNEGDPLKGKAQCVLLNYCQDVLRNQKEKDNSSILTNNGNDVPGADEVNQSTDHCTKFNESRSRGATSWESLHGQPITPTSPRSPEVHSSVQQSHNDHNSTTTLPSTTPPPPFYSSTSLHSIQQSQLVPPPPPPSFPDHLHHSTLVHSHAPALRHTLQSAHQTPRSFYDAFAPPPPPSYPPPSHYNNNATLVKASSSFSSSSSNILQTPSPSSMETPNHQFLDSTPLPESPPQSAIAAVVPSWTAASATSDHNSDQVAQSARVVPRIRFGDPTTSPPACLKVLDLNNHDGAAETSTLTLVYQRSDVQLYRRGRTSSNVLPNEAEMTEESSPLQPEFINNQEPDVLTALNPVSESFTNQLTASLSTRNVETPTTLKGKSSGSLLHPNHCKPCAFFWTKGCINAANCQFCHEWHLPKKKKPMKDQKNLMIIARPDGKIEFLRCTIHEALGRS